MIFVSTRGVSVLSTLIGLEPTALMTKPVNTVPSLDARRLAGADGGGGGDYHFLVMERQQVVPVPTRPISLYR